MILKFRDYQSNEFDIEGMGQLNESHQYSDAVCSVMDKLTFYVKRSVALETSSLNESAKRAYNKDIHFNRDERIAASCIFNEMLNQYKENMQEELSIYEAIINGDSILEEGVEYDSESLSSTLSLDEGKLRDLLKKGKEGLVNVAKSVIDGANDITVKTIDVVKAKKDDLVAWAKEAKKDFEEKYTTLKELVDNIVKKGIDSVQKFIDKILNVFSSLGDTLVEAVKKLGGLKMDKDEEAAKLDDIETDELYKEVHDEGEKSFLNNVILRVQAILSKDEDNAAKLMTESYVAESVVDNKFIAWLAGYKNDGTKMSWWKCILIGICASLIVWLLPKVLVFAGLGGALAAFIAALVGVVWNTIGILKLIYKRNKERQPGEKFFDKKTAIFFGLSIIAVTFSVATFVKTIAPLMQEICNAMGWTGGSDMSKFGEFVYNITKKISPKDCFHEGGFTEISEEIKNYGGDVRGGNLEQSKDAALDLLKKMPGASSANVKATDEFLSAAMSAEGSTGVYKALEAFKDNPDLPLVNVFDTSKWGGSGPIIQAIKYYKDSLPDSAILGTLGSEATTAASGGQFGFASYLTGVSQEQANMIFRKAAEFAGKDLSTLQLHTYGSAEIASVMTVVTKIKGGFDALAPDVPFLPMVMPFFDKKKWGDYKMRFASSTRGAAAYVVDRVEMLPGDKLEDAKDSKAFVTLQKLHDNAWEAYKKLMDENGEVNEAKKENDEKKDSDEPQYIVFYIRSNEDTGNASDKLKDEGDSEKEEKDEPETAIGVVIDTLTMMCADVCNFNKSVEIRRRPQPYFMKGLLSRLSFRPLENKDNETKDYIRKTLGQTMKTLVTQCVLYGMGKKYIDSKVDGKKAQYSMRQTILGEDKKKVNPNKNEFELGNFKPIELLNCLTDETENNKVSYEFLDGQYASKVTIKKDANGEIKSKSVVKDVSSIENVRYYRVSKESYKEAMDAYEEKKQAYKDGDLDKKPVKPTFIKGDDKEYYKRASKKVMDSPEFKRKKTYDYVDIRIIPLLKKGELYRKLVADEKFKKLLYTEDEENNVKLNKDAIKIIKPYLFRPESTFAREDEHDLSRRLKDEAHVEGEHLGWFKNLFKDEEQLHDVFKDLVEEIWDYLSENRRKVFKTKDFTANHTNESYEELEYTVFDEILEDMYTDEYDDEIEYEYDKNIISEQETVLSFEDFLFENK